MLILDLPYPPSTNTYWRHNRGRTHISDEGIMYRKQVALTVFGQTGKQPALSGRLDMRIQMYPPDRRRRDVDNILKATLDALGNAGVYNDDSQIDEIRVSRRPAEPHDGRLVVEILQINPG